MKNCLDLTVVAKQQFISRRRIGRLVATFFNADYSVSLDPFIKLMVVYLYFPNFLIPGTKIVQYVY